MSFEVHLRVLYLVCFLLATPLVLFLLATHHFHQQLSSFNRFFCLFVWLGFFFGCVPRRFQNVGSREWIFLKIWGLGNENLGKFRCGELEFWPKHG